MKNYIKKLYSFMIYYKMDIIKNNGRLYWSWHKNSIGRKKYLKFDPEEFKEDNLVKKYYIK